MSRVVVAKRLISILGGLFLGLLLAEGGIRLYKGVPLPPERASEHFRWAYVDIYRDFFKKDPDAGIFRSVRPRSLVSRFSIKKNPDSKRVFIIGESVAHYFDEKMLAGKIKEVLPQYEWEIINCGMGGYDSYRIRLVAGEIANYKPDIVVLMMGNNDGVHVPVKVNHWIHIYPYLSRFWTTRLVSEYLNPPRKIARTKINAGFERNLRSILNLFGRKGIPVVVVTLPVNPTLPMRESYPWDDKNFFGAWWLLWEKPEKAARIFKSWDDPRAPWFLATISEAMGEHAQSVEYYKQNIRAERIERNDILRKCSALAPSSILVDADKDINELANGLPDSRFFWDRAHVWAPVYRLIADRILESLPVFSGTNRAVAPPEAWRFDSFRKSTLASVMKEVDEIVGEKDLEKSFLKFILSHPDARKEYFLTFNEMLKFWYSKNPGIIDRYGVLFPSIVNNKEAVFLSNLGEMYREKKRLQRSLAVLNKAIAIDASQSRPYLIRGLCYYDMGERALAEADFMTFKRQEPGFGWLSADYFDALLTTPLPLSMEIPTEPDA